MSGEFPAVVTYGNEFDALEIFAGETADDLDSAVSDADYLDDDRKPSRRVMHCLLPRCRCRFYKSIDMPWTPRKMR